MEAGQCRISEADWNSYVCSSGDHTAAAQHGMSQGAGQPLNWPLDGVPGDEVVGGGFSHGPSPLPLVERGHAEPVGRRQEELPSLGSRRTERLVRCKKCPSITFTVRGKKWRPHADIERHLKAQHGATDKNMDRMIGKYISQV